MRYVLILCSLLILLAFPTISSAQPSCLTAADIDCSGDVDLSEAVDYINLWFGCSSCYPELFQVIEAYYGIYTTTIPAFPSDYISWWKFDGDATDEKGVNNGTFVSNAGTVFDIGRDHSVYTNGHALDIKSNTDYVRLTNNPSLSVGNFTISAWLKLDTLFQHQRIFSKGFDAYEFGLDNVNRMSFQGEINGNRVRAYSGPLRITSNVWHHVAVVWNGTNHTYYLDGSSVVGSCTTACNERGSFDISTRTPSIGDIFDGMVDDVILYNRSLTSDEIQKIHDRQSNSCTFVSKCIDYSDSNSCATDRCGIGGSCSWNGAECLRTESNSWYVRPFGSSYGSENGTSYDDAWDGLRDVVWGGQGVKEGDTLYVCGMHMFNWTVASSADRNWNIHASGTSEDTRITISGDCPSGQGTDQGIIWGTHLIAGAGSPWTFEGNDTYSTISSNYGGYFFEDVNETDWTVLTKAKSLQEVMDTPGSVYSPTYSYPNIIYFHATDGKDPTNRMVGGVNGWHIAMSGGEYITFEDLEFYVFHFSGTKHHVRWNNTILWYDSWYFRDGTHDLEFLNCDRAFGGGGWGFQDYYTATNDDAPHNILIKGCKIHDISGNPDSEGIGTNGVYNLTVEDNEFYRVGSAFTSYPYTSDINHDITIRRNYIHDTHNTDGSRGRGIEINNHPPNLQDRSNNRVYGNIVANCPGVCYRSTFDTYQVEFYNNIAYNCSTSYYFNAVYRNWVGPNIKLRNLISVNPRDAHIYYGSNTYEENYTIDSDYNLFWPNASGTYSFKERGYSTYPTNISVWQGLVRNGSTFDPHSIVADPMFVDPDNGNFRLKNGSPAIDAGIDMGLFIDLFGNAIPQDGDNNGTAEPDIGAYEHP